MRIICLLVLPLSLYSQSEYSFRDPKTSAAEGDSSFVYALPYKPGKSYFLIQGYDSKLSHKGEIALDFKMRKGTPVCAMRDGVVVEVKKDSVRVALKESIFPRVTTSSSGTPMILLPGTFT